MIFLAATLAGATTALSVGCRSTGPVVKVGPGGDLARYRRIGILPFTEPGGNGLGPAELVEKAIRALGIATVDAGQMGPVFDALRVERGAELGLEQLMKLRQATQAEALVFGSVAPVKKRGKAHLLILVIDGQSGDLVARGEQDIPSEDKGGLEAAIETVVDAIRDEIVTQRREPTMEPMEEP